MPEPMDRRRLAAVAAVALLGLGAAAAGTLEELRPPAASARSLPAWRVTSPEDAGPGSLREAIFAAAAADRADRIVVQTSRVEIRSPLPPLLGLRALTLEGSSARPLLDAGGLAVGPALEVATDGTLVRGLAVRGAARQGIWVRAAGVRLLDIEVASCDEGVVAAEQAAGLLVAESAFTANRIGLRLPADTRRAIVRDSRFSGHLQAAVWAVSPRMRAPAAGEAESPPALEMRSNESAGDRFGLVLGNLRAVVEDNRFEGHQTAIHLLGGDTEGGRGARVLRNRVRSGGTGIVLEEAWHAEVAGNRLDDQAAVAILLRGGGGNRVRENRITRGGYGVAAVFGERSAANVVAANEVSEMRHDAFWVVGGAPVIRGNRARGNRGFGIRILDFAGAGDAHRSAAPDLSDNELAGNVLGSSARGVYREPPAAEGG